MAPLLSSATSIPEVVFKKLNALANTQWEESLQYAAQHVWFVHNELPGSAEWCLAQSDAERKLAIKVFQHIADRRIEEEGKGAGTGWTTAGEQQPVVSEQPPHQSKTFEWSTTPNVYMEVTQPKATTFKDPIHIWKVALERERSLSKGWFECLQLAREQGDFVTENLVLHEMVPGQFKEENVLEGILENALLVTKRGPELYFELDRKMHKMGH